MPWDKGTGVWLPRISLKYRTTYDVRSDILEESKSGVSKTRIMYMCNLSYKILNGHLDTLILLGLLEKKAVDPRYENKKKFIYKTTDLGRNYIYVFQQLKKMLSGKNVDIPVISDKDSRDIAISALHEIKRKKSIYDHWALLLEKEPQTLKKIIEFLTGLDSIGLKTTNRCSQYYEGYLNFFLFNYLG